MKIIEKIKLKAPDASICGDVIVGFPGETDEGFQRTLDLMEEVKVRIKIALSCFMHISYSIHFKYSLTI